MRLKSVLAVLCLNIVLLPALVRAQGDSVGDPYFPLSGNTGYDVQHYTLEFDVRDDLLTFDAVATIDIQATAALAQFDLDLVGFAVTSVTVDSVEAAFTREGQELIIVPPTPIAADTLFTVIVSYNGTAELYDDPATAMVKTLSGASLNGGWQAWSEGYVQAMSQPNGAMSWYPCNNHPSDKATFTFRVTVDEPYTVVASGILEEVSAVDDDTNTFVWEMTDPMATQISSIAIGEFELEESVSPGGIPLRFYFPPSTPEATRDAFVRTGEMIDFMSEVMGGYPYDAYGAVVVPGWLHGSALEAQSLSVFSDVLPEYVNESENLVFHEMAHQWFGNALTVGRWDSIWLHEGFARYSEALWQEHKNGAEGYMARIQNVAETLVGETMSVPALLGLPTLEAPEGQFAIMRAADPGVDLMYLPSYEGGALTLHALRAEVGDSTFFEILRTYYQRYRDVPVTTDDFTALAEELAGRDLSSVWDTWLWGTILPVPLPTLQPAGQ